MLAGIFAGACYASLALSFDLLTVRAQTSKVKNFSYSIEVSKILEAEGIVGLTRGYSGAILRDVPGYAVYFGAYGQLKNYLGVTDEDKQANFHGISDSEVMCR